MFLAGLILFIGIHLLFATARGVRAAAISALGEIGYKGVYSLLSLVGLVMIVRGWPEASTAILYTPPAWGRTLTIALMLVASIAIVAAYLPAGKIVGVLKHPMVVGVKVWAFAHLLANGEVRSVLLFGGFLLFAVVDRIAVKKRGDEGRPAGPWRNDVLPLAIGVIGFVLTYLYGHQYLAGVALY